MPQDNDTAALKLAADALFTMEVKCRTAPGVVSRVAMAAERDKLRDAYDAAREKLIDDGIVVTNEELAEMAALTQELQRAADINATATAVLNLVGFFARIAAA